MILYKFLQKSVHSRFLHGIGAINSNVLFSEVIQLFGMCVDDSFDHLAGRVVTFIVTSLNSGFLSDQIDGTSRWVTVIPTGVY